MFEAHNTESDSNQEVLVFVDGEDKAVEAFCALAKTKRPARSESSNIAFEEFDGDIMKIGEYAQFCSTVQLNKAIPVLLDMRDDLKEMKGDIKAVRKNTDMIPQISEDIKEMKTDIKEMKEDLKGLRDDIQPGYGTSFRQVQSDVRAVKLRRRTPLQAGGACEAPPHEGGTRLCGHKPMLNTHALYPSRCKQRGIAFKIKQQLGML